jgi:oligopeptide transport system ATP-binding protein
MRNRQDRSAAPSTEDAAVQAAPADPPLLEVRDLCVAFRTSRGPVQVLDRVSFDLEAGERAAMVGESGSGKSVTALAILGLLPDTATISGSVMFQGRELVGLPDAELRALRGEEIALVFQDPLSALNPVYTVGHQVAEMFRRRRGLSKRESRERAVDVMQRVRIPHASVRFDQYPHQFSGGMRQRALIAMALALGPSLLIADEPTTALDVTVEAEITELLRVLSDEEGMALLFISHDLGVVASVAERVTVLYGGQVFEQGDVRSVYEHPMNPYTIGLLRSIPSGGDARGADLVGIPGRPPDPAAWPTGCRFHPRCWRAEERCEDGPVATAEVGRGRLSRCHFATELTAAST